MKGFIEVLDTRCHKNMINVNSIDLIRVNGPYTEIHIKGSEETVVSDYSYTFIRHLMEEAV